MKLGNGEVDGVHDIFRIAYLKAGHLPKAYLLPLLALGISLIVFIFSRLKLATLISSAMQYKPSVFVFVCGALLMGAMLIDLDLIEYEPLFLLEELLEMNAALALVFSSLSTYRESMIHPVAASPSFSSGVKMTS